MNKPTLAERAAAAAIKRAKSSATPVVKPAAPRDRAGGPVFTVEHGCVALLTKNHWGRVAHAVYMSEADGLVEALISIDRHTRGTAAAREAVAAHLKAAGAVSKKVLSVDDVLESFRWMCAKDFDATIDALAGGATMGDLYAKWLEGSQDVRTPWDAQLPMHQLDWLEASWQLSLRARTARVAAKPCQQAPLCGAFAINAAYAPRIVQDKSWHIEHAARAPHSHAFW